MNVILVRNEPFYKGVRKDLQSPLQDNRLTYTPGTTVTADGLDGSPDSDCGQGINFCRSVAEALRWGQEGTVVTVSIPNGAFVVDTGTKLRASSVVVGVVVDLSGADLYGAYLGGADLLSANLSGANLSNANLSNADLRSADLRGADLLNASLSCADLSYADLSNADLRSADLRGADLRNADLYGARGNTYTSLPSGWTVNPAGLIVKESA